MAFDPTALRDRAALNHAIRGFFDDRGYLEIETPVLAETPIPESHIELFRTERLHGDGRKTPMYLLPSPEYWIKLLLAAGAPSVYQIARCFRNGEQLDRWHRLEFTMLEWYALGRNAEENIGEMQDLLIRCAEAVRPGCSPEVCGEIRRITMEEAFRSYAGFSLEKDLRNAGLTETSPSDPGYPAVLEGVQSVLEARLAERGLPAGEEENADDEFHRLFLTLVEDELPADRPLALTHWPALVPTLARRIPDTPWSERWELYIRGIEVANCYGEETDPGALRAYWNTESPRKAAAEVPVETDSDWPESVSDGMPACSGAAAGLDRLLALIRGDDSLEGLDLFGINDMIRR